MQLFLAHLGANVKTRSSHTVTWMCCKTRISVTHWTTRNVHHRHRALNTSFSHSNFIVMQNSHKCTNVANLVCTVTTQRIFFYQKKYKSKCYIRFHLHTATSANSCTSVFSGQCTGRNAKCWKATSKQKKCILFFGNDSLILSPKRYTKQTKNKQMHHTQQVRYTV